MTVTSILDANALTTYSAAKAEIQSATQTTVSDELSQNAIERIINAVSDSVVQYCGRSFRKMERTEILRPQDECRLVLSCSPIDSNEDITAELDSAELDDVEVEDAALGFLWRDAGWGGSSYASVLARSVSREPRPGAEQRVLSVTYTAGYVTPSDAVVGAVGPPVVVAVPRTLPWDLEHAVLIAVCTQYRWMRSGYTKADAPAHNAQIARDAGGILPDAVLPILDKYKREF